MRLARLLLLLVVLLPAGAAARPGGKDVLPPGSGAGNTSTGTGASHVGARDGKPVPGGAAAEEGGGWIFFAVLAGAVVLGLGAWALSRPRGEKQG